jgi:hypothetical protein
MIPFFDYSIPYSLRVVLVCVLFTRHGINDQDPTSVRFQLTVLITNIEHKIRSLLLLSHVHFLLLIIIIMDVSRSLWLCVI